ncbi:MAG TPA: arginine--tRNA ligase [Candidatus Cybelea sp.]|jgi:arginyl-tRNA synthetase|nr:arginine--tRNA ligase [Candidatus Cybelea sp.]
MSSSTDAPSTRSLAGALRAFAAAIEAAVERRYPGAGATVTFEAPRRPEFGDFATNVAFSLAKTARRSPAEVASLLVADAGDRAPELRELFSQIEPLAGFVNLRLSPAIWHGELARILREKDRFGASPANGVRVSIEFGSANPTGPLVVVQGRSMSIGATLVNAMRYCGYDVFVEWIINDAGGQLDALGRSIYARYRQRFDPQFPFPEDGYPGSYLVPISEEIAQRDGERWIDAPESQWLSYFSSTGRDRLVAAQKETARRFGVEYDLWQSERELHETGKVREGIDRLRELGLTYEDDGALFFRATQFADDKDRVLLRRDGRPTYFSMDVAYHYQKLKASDRVVDILGPDHHGYIERLRGLATALEFPGRLEVLIAQQITLMRGSEHVSMSKRAGEIVTLDEIVDEVGVDAARFFFIMPAAESPLTFDLSLAVEKDNENPVYYVQYGHARIASVLRRALPEDVEAAATAALELLAHPAELALIARLAEFPGVVAGVVERLAPHRLARYARDVASDFHHFYTECKILGSQRDLRLARLALCLASKNVLAATLSLIGVGAPDTM